MGNPALQHKPPQLYISTHTLVYSSFCTVNLVVVTVKVSLRFHVTVHSFWMGTLLACRWTGNMFLHKTLPISQAIVAHFSRMDLLLQQWFCLCWITSIFEVSKGCIVSIKGLNGLQHNCKPYSIKKRQIYEKSEDLCHSTTLQNRIQIHPTSSLWIHGSTEGTMCSSNQYYIQTIFYNPTVTESKMFQIIKLKWVMASILVSFWLD